MQPDAKEDFVPPPTHRAVVIEAGDRVRVRDDVPLPALEKDQFLVRTEFVAVNPSDTKMRGPFVTVGGVLGTDYAGTVVARGTDVTAVDIGDRLPPSISTEGGSTFGAGISTAGLALKLLGLPLPVVPVEKPAYILVYGGSTATATIAIQLLRLANMIPIAACSPKNADQVKAYGAEETFDYRQPDSAAKIKAFTKNNLRYALDCITTVDSTTFCYAAIGRAGGKYVALDPFSPHAATRGNIKTDWVLGPTIFGDGSSWPAPYGRPPSAEIRAYGEKLWAVAQKLVDEGKLRHHPVKVLEESGLEQVATGMEMVKNGKLSGQKCVVRIIS
ncbi:NAD(P)-binding protein [Colletotrichum sublineola]|nr:NAD(P)-binding protein [Colletotrichum sublineola]